MNLGDFPQFWKTLREFKQLRDKYLSYYEKYMYFMGGLLGILALVIAIEGSSLVRHDFLINGRFGFARMRAGLILFLIFIALFIFVCSMFTLAITSKRNAPLFIPLLYAVFMFFFGAIPLMAEGNAILQLSRVENRTIETMCALNPRELRENTNKYTYKLFEMAHRFDDVSQYMLDKYMCTKTCPCHDYKESKPHVEFDWLPEYVLNPHGRTNENKEGYEPLLWVDEEAKLGFSSFMECYKYWEDVAETDPMIDLKQIFPIPKHIFGPKNGRAFKGPDRSDRYGLGRAPNRDRMPKNPSGYWLSRHMDDMEVFQVLEDDFNCSGMCKQGIFYFENPTHMGPPSDTCLKHLKEELANAAQPFAVTSIITGVVCFILFLTHFGLYFRPYEKDITSQQSAISSNQQYDNRPNVPGGQPELVPNVSTTQIGDQHLQEMSNLEMRDMYKQNNADGYQDPYGSNLQHSRKNAQKIDVVLDKDDDATDIDKY